MNESNLQQLQAVRFTRVVKGWRLALPTLLTILLVVWQWYWDKGHLTTRDIGAKAYIASSRITGLGYDLAVIKVYARKEQAVGGEAAPDAFTNVADTKILSALA